MVGGDFLALVRLGIRDASDPLVRDSIKVIDQVITVDVPAGPSWRRYNHDGYGQKEDGGAFDGTGVGRCWPILTGERRHHELAAGNDPKPFITAMEKFANDGGMITEQLWDSRTCRTAGYTWSTDRWRCRFVGHTQNMSNWCAVITMAFVSIASNRRFSVMFVSLRQSRERYGGFAIHSAGY